MVEAQLTHCYRLAMGTIETPSDIVDLWPTKLLRRTVPQNSSQNPPLSALILEMDAAHSSMTTDYRDVHLFERTEPCVTWLRDVVNSTTIDYLKHCKLNHPIDWTIHGWANVNRFGDYHGQHNHPRSYLSGTYYVQVPNQTSGGPYRADVTPNSLSFHDPRSMANMTAIKGDPNINPEYRIEPRAGLIALWPSFLNHSVHPNLSEDVRISISFNIVLKWRDSYLPDGV